MSADLNTVKIAIRAVLQSSKHGMNIRQLIIDYKELNGTLIPFKVFGFQNIEDFLRSIPDTVSMRNRGGKTIVNYTRCENTAHIEKLVKSQRGPKKKPQKSHAPKPLGHWRQGNQQGPARSAATISRFSSGTRNNSAKPARQSSSNNIRNDWNEWPNQPATNSNWESTQSQTKALNNPQIDEWSCASTSAIVPPSTAKSVNAPRPSTTYSGQSASYDKRMVSNPLNSSENFKKRTPPKSATLSQVTFDKPVQNFSKYTTNVIPERTVVFENLNDSIRSSKTATVKPISTESHSKTMSIPQIDEWSAATTSAIVSPQTAKSVNSPGPSTSYSGQNASYDDNVLCRLSSIERENRARLHREMLLYSFGLLYVVYKGISWFKKL